MRVLVTGGDGFVGRHLVAALRARGDDVVSAGRTSDPAHHPLDLSDAGGVARLVQAAEPDLVFHLAAQAFVPEANASPLATFDVNVMGTARLFEGVARYGEGSGRRTRIVVASSAEVYGIPERFPVGESAATRPVNPYGASKAAAEVLAFGYARWRAVDAIVYRGFNQIGPGQDARFAVPSFARQLARIAAGAEPVLRVGNLEAQRDFLDVRDAVEALVLLAQRGTAGEAYNVCSGRALAVSDVLRMLLVISGIPVEVREDPERMRPSDNPLSVGDPSKIRAETGWQANTPLETTLRDIYDDAKQRLTSGA